MCAARLALLQTGLRAVRASAASVCSISTVASRAAVAAPRWQTPMMTVAARAFASAAGSDLEQRVLAVLNKYDRIAESGKKVALTDNFAKDLGLDSLDAIELVVLLEDEFGLEIPDADAEKILSGKDAVAYLATKVK
eukprot:m.15043 g.15043  ORF g.15043 m.15043 type:complete len:137 (-) comp7301_c0_seq1:152-562(-)